MRISDWSSDVCSSDLEVLGQKKHIQGYLKDFLFEPGLADARIETLSGGEQSRLLLAREFARRSNLMVLDEPTNDLDMETLDLLQEVIADYDGTVLIVSHDRDFLDRTVTAVVGLDRSEEHTSELQSLMRISYAVFCLKKKHKNPRYNHVTNSKNIDK